MARIFISHSSANNDRAVELRDWLVSNGWDDFFLDLDPEHGIVAGEKWKEALKEAANRCEAVLALVSPEWLSRDWCRAELASAELLGKKTFVLLIGSKSSDLASSLKDAQYVDLINDPNAYTRLKEGLKRAGLDPTSFPFEEGRRPYPGFAPLEEEDAAIFFGRDAQIVRGLDKLRGLVRSGVERVLFILGASGSGKSSFLRAGLLPRLKRDDIAWLPLPTIRPERAVITGKFGLVEALYGLVNGDSFKEKLDKASPRSRADIEELITTRDDGLATILEELRQAGRVTGLATNEGSPPPTIVIPIDQGEELLNEEGREEHERFIEILVKTLERDRRVLVAFTMRTDSFPQVQNHPVLSSLPKDTFTLDRMPEGSYRTVIEGPAALVKPPLKIDAQLTESLLEDASGQDALALLAFTLRHLFDRYQAGNALTLEGYEKLGRLKGVIEAAVSEALTEGASRGELPKDKGAQLALIRMAFIPHLARVNEAGQFVRRVATRAEIPAEARPLIDRFADARLVVKDRRGISGGDESTEGATGRQEPQTEDVEVIEVAHEALLREWEDLKTALKQESQFLIDKAQLERDLADWQATPEARKKGALLSGNKLNRGRDWLLQRPQDLTADERQFIQASADADAARRRWLRSAAAAAFVAIAAAGVLAAWQWKSAEGALVVAQEQTERARAALQTAERNAAGGLTALSTIAKRGGDAVKSAKLALAAWPRTASSEGVQLNEVVENLSAAAPLLFERPWMRDRDPNLLGARFSADGTRYAVQIRGSEIIIADVASGERMGTHRGYLAVAGFGFSPDGKWFAASSNDDNAAVLWGRSMDSEPAHLETGRGFVSSVAFSQDGSLLAVGSVHNAVTLWDTQDVTRPINRFEIDAGDNALWHLALSPDKQILASGSRFGEIRFWEATTGAAVGALPELETNHMAGLGYSPDGAVVFAVEAGSPHRLSLWDSETYAELLAEVDLQLGGPDAFAFSPDGSEIAVGGPDGSVKLLGLNEIESPERPPLTGHAGSVTSVAFAPDGKRLLSGGRDGTARLWNLVQGLELERFDSNGAEVAAVAFHNDDNHISVGYVDGNARTLGVTADPTVSWKLLGRETDKAAALSTDGASAAVLAEDGNVHIYELPSGKEIASIPTRGSDGLRVALALSPNAVAIGSNGEVSIRRLAEDAGWQNLAVFEEPALTDSMVFSDDGKSLASFGKIHRSAGVAQVIDVATGKVMLKVDGYPVRSVTFADQGSRVLVRFDLGQNRWFDIADTPEPAEYNARASASSLPGGEDFVDFGFAQSIALSPDGRRAVTADQETIGLWDTTTGVELARFTGHKEWVRQVVFGPNDDQLVSITDDGTVGVWNLALVPSGDAFEVVCALLGDDHDLDSALEGYPIRVDEPICSEGYDPPLPTWMNKDTDQRSGGEIR